MTQDSAYFFYEQKVLAEDPSARPAVLLRRRLRHTALSGLTAGDYQTLLDAAFTSEAVQRSPATAARRRPPTGATSTTVTVTTTHDLRGRVHGHDLPHANDADCRWQFTPPSGNYAH